MAYRDLTCNFKESRRVKRKIMLRISYKEQLALNKEIIKKDFEEPLIGTCEDEMEQGELSSVPKWIKHVNEINIQIQILQIKVEMLAKVHTRRLMVRFDDSEIEYDQEIDNLTIEISQIFKSSESHLQNIAECVRVSVADANLRRNVQRSLATRLKEISSRFRRIQSDYITKLKSQKREALSSFDFLGEDYDCTTEDNYSGIKEELLDATSSMVVERDKEIRRIMASISDLSIVFKDMAMLVIDQGSVVDRIDYNMEQVVSKLSSGVKELHHAEALDQNGRATRCISLLLFCISSCFMILLVKHI